MTHYIAMGGEHGCYPDNCQAYTSIEDAIDGLDQIYELNKRQLRELKRDGITKLNRRQGGAYCEISECDCDSPWEHADYDSKDNWPEYADRPEEGDYIIECTGSKIIVYQYEGKILINNVKESDDIKKTISDKMEKEQYWPNIWNLSDHGNLSITTLEEV